MSAIKLWDYNSYDVDRLSKLADQKREEGRNYAKQKAERSEAQIRANFANAVDLTEGYSISMEGMRNKETGEIMSAEEKAAWLEKYSSKMPQVSLADREPATFRWSIEDLQMEHHTGDDACWNSKDTYKIDGVDFTCDETRKAVDVIHQAMSAMPSAGGVLHYQDYAKMGLAVAMVNQYSKENLNEEQAKVMDKAVCDWANYVIEIQTQRLKREGWYEDPSDNYFNKRKEITVNGQKSITTLDSASNQSMIRTIFDTYAKLNPRDKSAVEKANNTLYNLLLQAYRPTSGKGAEQFVSWIMPEVRTSASNVTAFLNNISKGGIDVRV